MTKGDSMLFHVTERDLGDSCILTPYDPGIEEEPDTPRICCAPTIHQCFSAIGIEFNEYHVYSTTDQGYIPSVNVSDSCLTEEKWFIKPTRFKRFITLNKKFVKKLLHCNSGRGWWLTKGTYASRLKLMEMQTEDFLNLDQLFHGM